MKRGVKSLIGGTSHLLILSLVIPSDLLATPTSGKDDNNSDKPEAHFKHFSQNLLLHSDLDEFSMEKGAAISSPFGVGYMLANINEKVWNVSNEGVDQVLETKSATDDYKNLIDKMQKGQMSISSTLFTRDQNVSSSLPEGSRKLKTETKLVNFIEEWKSTWNVMNGRLVNQTNGLLDDQLIPKGSWYGGAFYYFTMGAYLNTNHYRGTWDANFVEIGPKKFHDGQIVPYYEAEGTFPLMQSENYTAIAIKLKDGKKSVILVLPKTPLVSFLQNDMGNLVQNGGPRNWTSLERKIQVPQLNITLLDQHYKKLEALGMNYTFCVDETNAPEIAKKKGTHFMGPIVQSHHVTLTSKYFEVASATGSSLNSEEKMRKEGSYDGPSEETEEVEKSSEETGEKSEFTLPIPGVDPALLKALAEVEILTKEMNITTVTAPPHIPQNKRIQDQDQSSSSTVSNPLSISAALNKTLALTYPSSNISTTTTNSSVLSVDLSQLEEVGSSTPPSTTPFSREPLPPNTIRFDQPFFWYLHDEEMGPLYYGAVNSLATYHREYGIESEEDIWLYDAYKTLLWNCP